MPPSSRERQPWQKEILQQLSRSLLCRSLREKRSAVQVEVGLLLDRRRVARLCCATMLLHTAASRQHRRCEQETTNERRMCLIGLLRASRVHTKHNCSGRDMESSSTCPAVRNRKLQLDCVVARAVCWYTTPYRHRYVWVSQWWCTSLHQVAEKPARPRRFGKTHHYTTEAGMCIQLCALYQAGGLQNVNDHVGHSQRTDVSPGASNQSLR